MTYVDGCWFRSFKPKTDTEPSGCNTPDDVTTKDDDEKREEVGRHDDCEA
jgi:hypothetical protein